MTNDRIVVQVNIVVNGDEATVVKTVVDENGETTQTTGGGGGGGGANNSGSGSVNSGGGNNNAGGNNGGNNNGNAGGNNNGNNGNAGAGNNNGNNDNGGNNDGPNLPEIVAQRVVHIIAGNGGLAWFTQVWPVPAVITQFNQASAYDDVSKAIAVPDVGASHPLFTRKIADRFLWQGTGNNPQPSVFVAGTNQTHTANPSTMNVGANDVIAAATVQQTALNATVPTIAFGSAHMGTAPGAGPVASVALAAAGVSVIKNVVALSPADEQALTPSDINLATWGVTAATPANVAEFARTLWFAAQAFRLGHVATVVMPAFNDDPHGAFANGTAAVTAHTELVTSILDNFYKELGKWGERSGKHNGQLFPLADNVVMVISGDTYKNPFNRDGWGDGTPGNSNLIYVRSNGFLKPGWFGKIEQQSGRTNFDPTTGELAVAATIVESATAAQLGILFAITRGKTAPVTAISAAPFKGVIANPLP